MKKFRLFLLTAAALSLAFTACQPKEEEGPVDENSIGKFPVSQIVDAAAAAFSEWESSEAFPTTFKVGDKDFTVPQFQYAICSALVNLNAGKKEDIEVMSYKPADHPERDSYDKEEIAMANGPKNGDETEDLVNIATRMLSRMKDDLKVPNQTNFTRNGSAIAFSTDRATIVISRALKEYKAAGSLPASISANYKGASNTLKAFAKEFVKYLDVWQKTVGTVDADGSHCTANNTAWENVHFIPIEYSGGYKDGTMYSEYYQPYYHVNLDGHEYTAAECWSIAAQGIMDLVTKEGSSLLQPTRNPFIHTMGNGKSLNEPYPTPAEYATVTGFNAYPWYENTEGGTKKIINFSETNPCTVEFLCHELGWYLTRCTQFDTPAIGNFQEFGADDAKINFGSYEGIISAMRTFLIMARFYEYLLANNIEDNVWDAMKDVHLNYDLYGVDMPDIELKTKSLDFDCTQQTKEAKFSAKKAWTATASDSWITVDQLSGEPGDVTLKITVAENTGDAREGKVIVKGGNVTEGLEIAINQVKYTPPAQATIKEFAEQYVHIIDVWSQNVGKINRLSNWELAKDTDEDVVENVHYVPNDYTILVGGKTYNIADMLETAVRSYLLLRGWDGNETEKNGYGNIPAATPIDMNAIVPNTHDYSFGSPLIESSNGGYLVKIEGEKEIHCQVDPLILDNWAQRSVNYNHGKNITNFCTYPRDPITNYSGCFSSGRALLTYAYFFKYMLDNNLEKADAIPGDTPIHSELFGNEEGSQIEEGATLKDFAKEFVKGLQVWENTIGTVDADGTHCTDNGNAWENVHFIPIEGNPNSDYYKVPGNQYDPKWASKIWKLNVKGKEYSSSQAWEIAIRGLLNMCTAEGEAFLDGMTDRNKAYTLQDGLAMSKAPVSEPSADNKWGKHPWYESNNLVKNHGLDVTEVDLNFMIKVGAWHVVRSFIKVGSNSPLGMIGNFQEFGTSSGTLNLDGYVGYISPMRELLVLMRIYKYLLDSGIDSNVVTALQGKMFDFDLYGQSQGSAEPTIEDFAKEYVKILDIWESTTGTIDYVKASDTEGLDPNSQTLVENAHYVPMATTIHVGDAVYGTADMLELALRSYLLLRGWDGNETEKNGFGNIPTATPVSIKDKLPATHKYYFGSLPYAEPSNGGYLCKKVGDTKLYRKVEMRVLDNWAQRSVNFQHGQSITNMCTYPRDPISDYEGCFSSMRALITYAHFFKYVLDHNLEKADALGAELEIRSELFGVEGAAAGGPLKAEWLFSAETLAQYADKFGGTAGAKDKAAGDGGLYVESNVTPGGKITYVQIDKTELDVDSKASRIVGSTGHPYVTGAWKGDYWLFTLGNGSEIAAGKQAHIKYITRTSATGLKYWMAEYFDGNEWKPALEVKKDGETEYNIQMNSDGKTNVEVEATFTLAKAVKEVQFRMRGVTIEQASGNGPLDKPNGGTCRIAGAEETSPVFEVL